MEWWVVCLIIFVGCFILALMFMRGAAKNNAIADKLADEWVKNKTRNELYEQTEQAHAEKEWEK